MPCWCYRERQQLPGCRDGTLADLVISFKRERVTDSLASFLTWFDSHSLKSPVPARRPDSAALSARHVYTSDFQPIDPLQRLPAWSGESGSRFSSASTVHDVFLRGGQRHLRAVHLRCRRIGRDALQLAEFLARAFDDFFFRTPAKRRDRRAISSYCRAVLHAVHKRDSITVFQRIQWTFATPSIFR